MTHFLDAMLEPALWFLADWSLRWAVPIAVVAAVLALLRPRRAATRQLLLGMALLGGLLLPFTPRWSDGWRRTAKEISTPPPTKRTSVTPSHDREGAVSIPRLPRIEESKPLPHGRGSWGARRLAVLGLGVAWSLSAAFLLLRWVCGAWLLRRLRRESVEVTDATDLLSACRAALRLRSRVRLATHPRICSPILLGVFRPLILVPADWQRFAAEARRAVLLHELAHVRRRDHWLAPFLKIVRIAFFFHPLVRWLLMRLEYERELLCDESVVALGIDRRDYAHLLLEFARASGHLAWSAAPLSMSRRRTVKSRIHHLLEEDMERWIRPLPVRRLVVLGMGLLALMLGVASYRVRAVEKEERSHSADKAKKVVEAAKPAENKLKREELRYGGKDFNQWRGDLLSELKGSIRVDGMKAFAAFGANGYAAEATEAILEMMRGYDTTNTDPKDDDGAVVKAGYESMRKIGAEAVPALTAAVKSTNRNVRRFAVEALGNLNTEARPALPAILQAMKVDDVETRRHAMEAVSRIDPHAQGFVEALIEILKGKDQDSRLRAVDLLGSIGKEARPAIPSLIAALGDNNGGWQIINALRDIGAGKEAVVPVSRLLQAKVYNVRDAAYEFLDLLGADAKEAVPALIAVLKAPSDNFTNMAINTLAKIGPGAKEAIPALNELLRNNDPNRSRGNIIEALKAIDPDGKR
jgi:beta-lactamase regulating signal transducer with metallopeptidase domain